jgi:hypothetical protein
MQPLHSNEVITDKDAEKYLPDTKYLQVPFGESGRISLTKNNRWRFMSKSNLQTETCLGL